MGKSLKSRGGLLEDDTGGFALRAEFGDGIPQSTEMANHWFAKAYDAGVSDRARLKSGYLRMKNLNK